MNKCKSCLHIRRVWSPIRFLYTISTCSMRFRVAYLPRIYREENALQRWRGCCERKRCRSNRCRTQEISRECTTQVQSICMPCSKGFRRWCKKCKRRRELCCNHSLSNSNPFQDYWAWHYLLVCQKLEGEWGVILLTNIRSIDEAKEI